jgi:benzoylformate decarboxylase
MMLAASRTSLTTFRFRPPMTGIHAFVQMLADAGVQYVFGNPGTTELPLNDVLLDEPQIAYRLGLQEVPVMAMADGYAMASGKLGVVNLHISCGLGNAMGMLYNAFREGTPLLVTAGQQDQRIRFEEPILAGEMVEVARPWTKWACEVARVEDLPNALRRAVRLATTPPTGPVFLSLPLDIQRADATGLDLTPPKPLDYRTRPPKAALEQAAKLLAAARNPAILAGSRVVEADAVQELVALAERLGAPVFSEPGHANGRQPFPCDHGLYGQALPHWSPEIRERLAEFDVLFCTGLDVLRLYVYFEPSRAISEHCRIIHLDESPYQIGKNYPVELGLLGDTQAGLAELLRELSAAQSSEQRNLADERAQRWNTIHEQRRIDFRSRIDADRAARPMTNRTLMSALANALPDNVAVVEEAVTTTNTTLQKLGALKNCDGYFAHRGWALGWGLNCAIGVQQAWTDRPVLAIIGEGSALYGIQGLWSAAKYNLPVTFVIPNNAQYQILKAGARALGLPAALDERFLGMELRDPEVDIVGLAKAFGVAAETISEPDAVTDAVRSSLASDRPRLINVPIERTLAGPG